ncbi:hypothetical protein SAMN05421837_10398 [Amycolatopsis pretoriensis]|uniref:V8-like Glu-specific endopeptidase n=1 Tax=Amycolatopsis pretoriensis TaxID=218821 RepID=A0A1H5QLA3_9PSEU|nr:hypothetical protein [Amycolatopsis pretoriensis]SEF26138.1 hypothetical protein SAMN05421837_10398 [Amycolatopsis pretoriensis]
MRRWAGVAAVVALGGLLVHGTAQAGTPAVPGKASAAVVQQSTTAEKDVLSSWTPERMRAAKPVDVPREQHGAEPQSHVLAARSAPGAAVTKPGQVRPDALTSLSQSQVWTAHGQMPATTVGKLYFDKPDGGYQCTASVINSTNRSMIWTAGHCVTDGAKHWYSNFVFVPDYAGSGEPLGRWSWKSVSTPNGYFDGKDSDYDFAAITLWPRAGVSVANVTGWQGYKFGQGYDWNVYEFGYPSDTHPARTGITGQQLRYCTGTTWRPGIWPFQPDQEAIHCDQGHGASGGPWLDDLQLARGWGYLVGNVSYHSDDNSDEERSPHFGDAAINVYNAQQAA